MAHGRPDFSPTAVDVVLRPEWAAKEGVDKNLRGYAFNVVKGAAASVSYIVPAGKTLYITHLSASVRSSEPADSDLNQICEASMKDATTGAWYGEIGGNGGCGADYTKPIVFPGGHTFQAYNTNGSGHLLSCYINAHGYEV